MNGVVKLVKVGEVLCNKDTRRLEEAQPMEAQSRSQKCSANGAEKWGGSRLDKVVEDCVWIECNGNTGKYEFVQNQFCECRSKLVENHPSLHFLFINLPCVQCMTYIVNIRKVGVLGGNFNKGDLKNLHFSQR